MHRRSAPFWLLLLTLAASAQAGTVHPDLSAAFAAKAPGTSQPVLLLMGETLDLTPLQPDLEGLAPRDRARRVAETLRSFAAESQRDVLAVLRAEETAGRVEKVRTLWTLNAIAFQAPRASVEELARVSPTRAELVLDRGYDMIGAVDRPGTRGQLSGPPTKIANAWNVEWVRAHDVWTQEGITGAGVVVLHVDSGVDLTHPDLVDRIWVNPGEIPGNQMDDDANGYVDDVNGYDFVDFDSDPRDDIPGGGGGHGTHTAGTIAGDGSSGIGTGVAPGASIMVAKVFPTAGGGAPFSALYEAHQYAIENGARIVNQSLGVAGTLPDWLHRQERNQADVLRNAGLILVSSAGNDHFLYSPPEELGITARVPSPWHADAPNFTSRGGVIAVAGTGYKNNTVYASSARGPADWSTISPWNDWPALIKPDIAAPGVGVNSTIRGGGYSGDSWNGTSMSAPHVTGTVALMLERNPTLSPEKVDEILQTTATDLGSPGKDNTFGAGRLHALRAVRSVPPDQYPHVYLTGMTIEDETGDGVIDPGESFDVRFHLRNNSPTVAATGVTGIATVAANAYVSVVDGETTFPDIPPGGTDADNLATDPVTFATDPATPQGFTFTVLLDLSANGNYQRTLDFRSFVGLPEYLDHDVGAVVLTVTDQGSIGYMSDGQAEGRGFAPAGSPSGLFIGSFWGGNSARYICNRDYSTSETFEWEVTTSPNGRVRDLGAVTSDQDYAAVFRDSGHAAPLGIQVTQQSYAWAEEGFDEFVLLIYTVRQLGGDPTPGWFGGMFCDFDIGNSAQNRAGTDDTRNLSYVRVPGGEAMGIAYLGSDPVSALTVINNPQYVYPLQHIDDGIKLRHLQGTISTPDGATNDDWSVLTGVGPYDLTPGEDLVLPFALVYGPNLGALGTNADAARQRWEEISGTPQVQAHGAPTLTLAQNHPNPFNPRTTIRYAVDRAGPVTLVVYDLAGRRIRTLVDGAATPGAHVAEWDGRDDAGRPVASGLYLYRLDAAGRELSGKMMLVK